MSAAWPPPAPAATTCYRHPRAQAPVSCTRCGRPVCTDCMVSAPVGWQCPECTKGAPPVRRLRPDGGGFSLAAASKPYATYGIIAACVAVYVAQQSSAQLVARWAISAYGVKAGDWWQVVTAGFLHASVLHIAFNMLVLFQLGTVLEARVGRARFLGVYAAALVGGSVGELLLSAPNVPAVGASGAIFGLMGAVLVLPRSGRRSPIESSVLGLLVVNLVITFTIPNIAIGGHLGGLVAGAAAGLVIRALGEERTPAKVAGATAALFALAAVLFAVALPVANWAVANKAVGLG